MMVCVSDDFGREAFLLTRHHSLSMHHTAIGRLQQAPSKQKMVPGAGRRTTGPLAASNNIHAPLRHPCTGTGWHEPRAATTANDIKRNGGTPHRTTSSNQLALELRFFMLRPEH